MDIRQIALDTLKAGAPGLSAQTIDVLAGIIARKAGHITQTPAAPGEPTEADALQTIRTTVFARLVWTMPAQTHDHLEKAVDETMVALESPMIRWVFSTLAKAAQAREAARG